MGAEGRPWSPAAHRAGGDYQARVSREARVCVFHPGAGVRGPLITGRWAQ